MSGIEAGPQAATTPSVRLRRKIDLVIQPYAKSCRTLVTHPRLADLRPRFLLTQHQIIRATVPLTEVAAERAEAMAAADPLASGLARYLKEHVEEELGHDDSLLDDLELLGVKRASVLSRMPSPSVASLVGAQYYWIHHHHPIAFLGFVALMEGHPPTPTLIETLISATGYPRAAFQTFAEHGELDPGHRDRLDRTIDALPLTDEHETVMGISAMHSAILLPPRSRRSSSRSSEIGSPTLKVRIKIAIPWDLKYSNPKRSIVEVYTDTPSESRPSRSRYA